MQGAGLDGRGCLRWGWAWGMEDSPIASERVKAHHSPPKDGVHWGGVQDHD